MTLTSAEFNSKVDCNKAEVELLKKFDNRSTSVVTLCVPKGRS
jgi:hypothetical protein